MISPVVVYPEPQTAAVDALRAGLVGRESTYTTGVKFIPQPPPTASSTPLIRIAVDSNRPQDRVITRALLRVTVWHLGESLAHDLGQLCHGLMLAHSGDSIAACYEESGPIPGFDPEPEMHFSTFTVRAVLRGRAI